MFGELASTDQAWCMLPGSAALLHFQHQDGQLVNATGQRFHFAPFFQSDFGNTLVAEAQQHQATVARAVEWMKGGSASKVVLSRVKKVELQHALSTESTLALLRELRERYPQTFVYCLQSAHYGTWIGATPETLVSVEGTLYRTMALAGTRPAQSSGNWGQKEQHEQAMVTEDILKQLSTIGATAMATTAVETVQAGRVEHLRTGISFSYSGEWFDVVQALHPTPAVGGFPREAALAFIRANELHRRGLYAGYLGVTDGDAATIFVNLRCMRIEASNAYLFVGGGITAQSDPAAEWQETEWKSRTLLDVLIAQGFAKADHV